MQAAWRYNIIVHMILHHEQPDPQFSNTYIIPKMPGSMLLNTYISQKEEQAMGITPQTTVDYQDSFGMMKSDDPTLKAYQGLNPLLKPKQKLTLFLSHIQSNSLANAGIPLHDVTTKCFPVSSKPDLHLKWMDR
jgi:hypothetical protein